ncbi:MAG: phosphate ABC transporter permease subunit PstC [Acidobacteriota bacterium]
MRLGWVRGACVAGGLFAGLFFLGQLAMLAVDSLPLWRHQSPADYLGGVQWFYRAELFGVLPMIYGTVVVATVAILVAAPFGLGTALFTAEYLNASAGNRRRRDRWVVKSAVELLAGVPSVVYGLIGVLVLRDVVYRLAEPFDPLSGDTLLTAGLLLSVMILPTVTTFADDALAAVPADQRRAARALGLSRGQTIARIALPQALPGLAAAVLLALGRALGETIAVFLVVGRLDNRWPEHPLSPAVLLEPGQTLTSKLGGSETFLAWGDPLHWAAMVSLGLVLLVLTLGITLIGRRFAGVPGRDQVSRP